MDAGNNGGGDSTLVISTALSSTAQKQNGALAPLTTTVH